MPDYVAKTDFVSGGQEFWPTNLVPREYVAGAERTLVAMGYIQEVVDTSGLSEPGTRPDTDEEGMMAMAPEYPPQQPGAGPSDDYRTLSPEEIAEQQGVDPEQVRKDMEDRVASADQSDVPGVGAGVPAEEAAELPEPKSSEEAEEGGEPLEGSEDSEESEGSSDEPNATKGAQELAEEKNIDLSTVEGTGQGGKITKDDVQKASG